MCAEVAAEGSRRARARKPPSLSKTSDTLSYVKAFQKALDKLKEQLPDHAMASKLEGTLRGCVDPIAASLTTIIRWVQCLSTWQPQLYLQQRLGNTKPGTNCEGSASKVNTDTPVVRGCALSLADNVIACSKA